MNSGDDRISPARADAGVTTAPTLSAADEIADLRAEVARLKALLHADHDVLSEEVLGETAPGEGAWPADIDYHEAPYSGGRLGGISGDRSSIRPTADVPGLPQPTADRARLEADFMRFGYCVIGDSFTALQVDAQKERLLDQAEAERAAGVASVTHKGSAQTVFNILPKGQVFRDLVALEPNAIEKGPLIESLLEKMLGKSFYLGTAHGSVVHEGGGLQELHQDQGYVPMPHPTYPLTVLIIHTYTDFTKDNGATYILPGSHRDVNGQNLIRPGAEFEELARGKLLALTVPAGCSVLMDARVLHCGGKRTAAGTRLATRILYQRAFMRQQENQLAGMTDEMFRSLSPKLQGLIGFKTHLGLGMVEGDVVAPTRPKLPVGELSMANPESFEQDFDWRYSSAAKRLAKADWNKWADYRGPREDAQE